MEKKKYFYPMVYVGRIFQANILMTSSPYSSVEDVIAGDDLVWGSEV